MQQTAANAEQMRDIEERVRSLSEVLASPVGDQDSEEKARREVLRKFGSPPYRTMGTSLNRIGYSQEVDKDCCKSQTAFRTTRDS